MHERITEETETLADHIKIFRSSRIILHENFTIKNINGDFNQYRNNMTNPHRFDNDIALVSCL